MTPEGVSSETWEAFIRHRRAMRRPLTPDGANRIIAELGKHPGDGDAMLNMSIANGWLGVFHRDHGAARRSREPERLPTTADFDAAEHVTGADLLAMFETEETPT